MYDTIAQFFSDNWQMLYIVTSAFALMTYLVMAGVDELAEQAMRERDQYRRIIDQNKELTAHAFIVGERTASRHVRTYNRIEWLAYGIFLCLLSASILLVGCAFIFSLIY